MPFYCAMPECNSNGYRPRENIMLHRFPKNKLQREKWIAACNLENKNTKNARICSLHFKPSDYERHLKYELLGLPIPNTRRTLKADAVPVVQCSTPQGDEHQEEHTSSGAQPAQNIDGSTPSCSTSRTPAGPLSIAGVSSGASSTAHSPGLSSTSSNEEELLLDGGMDLKLEIKEEVVDEALTEFVNVLDHVEQPPGPKECDVDALAESKPSTSASSSNIDFVDVTPHQMKVISHPVVLTATKPSSTPSTSSSALLRKADSVPPRIEDADEFYLFGMFVASQLRALPLRDALQAQLEIQTILSQKRSERLT